MLYVLFRIRTERYAVAASEIVEVLPMVRLRPLAKAPAGVVGLFNYHGTTVPVIDLTLLTTGVQAPSKMTTRLAVIKYRGEATDEQFNLLGVLAEKLTETLRADPSEFKSPGVDSPEARYLGPVIKDHEGMVQRIEITQLLPAELRANLFTQVAAVSS